jgi:simple sugar transport system permease protein
MRELMLNFMISGIALVLSLAAGAVVTAWLGADPLATYAALFKGSFGSLQAFTSSLTGSVPLIFSGLAIALAFRSSVFNIGVEGQLIIGAMAAALVGAYIELPAILHLPLTLIASMAGGMLWAFFPAWLKHRRNVHIVISTIMFNYLATYVVQYLILGPFSLGDGSTATKHLAVGARLPRLLPGPYVLNAGFLVALVAIVLVWFLLTHTARGYEMRAVGLNQQAALANGIDVPGNMFLAMLLSGALAGLGGGVQVSGTMGRIFNGFSPNYGFNGIPVALMARNNPFAIFFSALLFGSMRNGSLLMQSSVGVSKNLIEIIQGMIIVFLCAEHVIRYHLVYRRTRKEASTTPAVPPPGVTPPGGQPPAIPPPGGPYRRTRKEAARG